jgi:Na+/proline symporter
MDLGKDILFYLSNEKVRDKSIFLRCKTQNTMTEQLPYIILGVILMYFLLLSGISYLTTKKSSDNDTFFLANRKAPWYLVTIGLIGASISGVTFVSVPGNVGKMNGVNMGFSYLQLVFGYVLGYVVIAFVLLPVYYRMNLVSIYGYLEKRFGFYSYKTGAAFFLLSRTIGSAFRMFLMILILQKFALSPLGVPIAITAFVCIFLVWLYTYKGGTQTILYTDVVLTFCFIGALILTIFSISNAMDKSVGEMTAMVWNSDYSRIFFFKNMASDPNNFFKQFISGALITITMTGLDQDLMQKNLACKNIGESQKNMFTFSAILVIVNLLFLFLGGYLYLYASTNGLSLPDRTDLVYPTIALKHLSTFSAVIFIIGIVGSTFSSSDSALIALTTSACVDFFDFNKRIENVDASKYDYNEEKVAAAKQALAEDLKGLRLKIHTGMALLLFALVMIFAAINNESIINELFKAAGYTYGPLLGLYTMGLATNRKLNDKYVPFVCLISPVIAYLFNMVCLQYKIDISFLILLINGMITFLGLFLISTRGEDEEAKNIEAFIQI